jgi:hypothetical protein
MVRALAEAVPPSRRDEYATLAMDGATFLFDWLVRDGRVLRSYSGGRARIAGYLRITPSVWRRCPVRADLRRPGLRARILARR